MSALDNAKEVNSGPGWYEVINPSIATTEIVRVMEDGSIYCPEGVLTRDEFAFAAATGKAHRLIRVDEVVAEHERVLTERAAPQEWEYGSALLSTSGAIWDATLEASLEEAEEAVQLAETSADDYAPDECIVVRRTRAVLASDWEPLPEDTNHADRAEQQR